MLHISKHFLGETAIFMPFIPNSQNRTERELPARICAAPTLKNCWDSIKVCTDFVHKMQENNVNGYYFFVYEFKSDGFIANCSVLDFAKTCEHISLCKQIGTLVDVFYMPIYKLRGEIENKEYASVEEASSAYSLYQKEDLQKIEAELDATDWD